MAFDKTKIQACSEFTDYMDILYLSNNQKIKAERDATRKTRRGFSPSFVSRSTCDRAWYYHYIRIDEDELLTPRSARIFSLGNAIHDRIQDLLSRSGVSAKDLMEFRLEDPEWQVRGYVDGILVDSEKKLVLEIKSSNERKFKECVRKNMPQEAHIKQTNMYMWLLDIKHAIIYYENKNTCNHYAWKLERDDVLIQSLKDQITKIKKYAESEIVPDVGYNSREFECKYCFVKSLCQNIGASNKKGATGDPYLVRG